MGCMYPGSIRTESIESMEHCYPDCRFQASNIDEQDNEISRGELQITENDLIYFKPSKFPTRWPLDCIRRYGCTDHGDRFVFEVGRKCSTGQAIFAFRLNRGAELVQMLKERIDKSSMETTPKPAAMNCGAGVCGGGGGGGNHHDMNRQRKRDASTSTDNQNSQTLEDRGPADPKPLCYALIDFDTTKALTESAQAHAASRAR